MIFQLNQSARLAPQEKNIFIGDNSCESAARSRIELLILYEVLHTSYKSLYL